MATIGYQPVEWGLVDDLAGMDPATAVAMVPTWVHPSRGISEAQRASVGEGTGTFVLRLVVVPAGLSGCCPLCFRRQGGTHACSEHSGRPVLATDCVYRPSGEVIA